MNPSLEQSTVITIGARVRVKREQVLRFPRHPGRIGRVLDENPFGLDNGGLWHVRLEATRQEREEDTVFYSSELEVVEGGVS